MRRDKLRAIFQRSISDFGYPSLYIYDVKERETNAESAGNSATIALLKNITDVIRKSDKTEGRIISESEQKKKFQFLDIVTIRKFAILAGIKIDETKFRNLMEFRQYFGNMIKLYNTK